MDPEEFRVAQKEIGKGVTWSSSSIESKTDAKTFDWDRLVQAYNDDMGWSFIYLNMLKLPIFKIR